MKEWIIETIPLKNRKVISTLIISLWLELTSISIIPWINEIEAKTDTRQNKWVIVLKRPIAIDYYKN